MRPVKPVVEILSIAAGNGAKAKVRPIPGNAPHDRPVSRVISSSLKENLRRCLPRHCRALAAKNHTGRPVCVFQGMAESIWSDVVQHQKQKTKPRGGRRAASRRSAPSPGRRTRREDHALAHRPQMSSGRLFLDRVARQHCPSPLPRRSQNNIHLHRPTAKGDIFTLQRRGHFYFALTRVSGGSDPVSAVG